MRSSQAATGSDAGTECPHRIRSPFTFGCGSCSSVDQVEREGDETIGGSRVDALAALRAELVGEGAEDIALHGVLTTLVRGEGGLDLGRERVAGSVLGDQ